MKTGRDYGKLFQAQLQAQKEKLDENEHKPGFDELTFAYTWKRINNEFEELQHECTRSKWDLKKVRREAADLANFLGMLILTCDEELEAIDD